MATKVLIELSEGVATVTLNRPEARNAVDPGMRAELTALLQDLGSDDKVVAIVLTGAGSAFCAGQDLRESQAMQVDDVSQWQRDQRRMYQSLRDLDKPCLAAINGPAVGTGLQLALCADVRVAHAGVSLRQPEVAAGMASIVGSHLLMTHVGVSLSIAMSLTGEAIDGGRAYALGLVHRLVEPALVLGVAQAVGREMAALPRTAFRLTKARFREVTQRGFDEACSAGTLYQKECFSARDAQGSARIGA